MFLKTKIWLTRVLDKIVQAQTRRRVAALRNRARRREKDAMWFKAEAQFLERSILKKDGKSE